MNTKKYVFYIFLAAVTFLFWGYAHPMHAEFLTDAAFKGISEIRDLRHDSAFLAEYSSRLGIHLDSTCNPALIAAVAGWIGTPYRHAGYSKAGIDCSGFVSRIYRDVFGVELTHSSSGMLYQMKEHVRKSDIREGDVLFFRIHGRRISHVGLYLGEHRFIHASPERGIVIDDLREPYYTRTYYTAGRPCCNEQPVVSNQ